MRISLILKTIFRSPVKAILTLFLIAAASFTLFLRITDYAVTGREAAHAESFYHGVAALDNTVPEMIVDWEEKGIYYSSSHKLGDKPWPKAEELAEFSSLSGVTHTDRRYMTAGIVDGCKRVMDERFGEYSMDYFVLEGTYEGYKKGHSLLYLSFDNVTVLASECGRSFKNTVKIEHMGVEDFADGRGNAYPESFWKKLKKGSRVLIRGKYWEEEKAFLTDGYDETMVRVLDGVGANYLDTAEFSYYKQLIEAINQDKNICDIVYTSDMRSIPRFNERKMVVTEGRPLTTEDTDVCVVSEPFLKSHGLSVGDKINVRLGDRLFSQHPLHGAKARGDLERVSKFVDDVEVEIAGTYRLVDDLGARVSESDWSYSSSTIFVPSSLLPIEVPSDYEPSIGEFSVYVENAHDIETFKEKAEALAAKMGVALRFSDGGWHGVKGSFKTGTVVSLLTTVLYVLGAALALLLAIYLFVGRNRESYAIMRALGVPRRKAGGSLILPLAMLAAVAIPAGGIAGLLYTSQKAAKSLEAMADSVINDYIPDTMLPVDVIVIVLFCELLFVSLITLFFVHRMKKIPPMDLLQGHTPRKNSSAKALSEAADYEFVPVTYDSIKIPEVKLSSHKKYYALQHVFSYVLRHIWRSGWKSAVSLLLTIVLAFGVGMLALAMLTYQDAFGEVDVKVTALDFASSNIAAIKESELLQDIYCYNNFEVRTNGLEMSTRMLITNDLNRYLTGEHIPYTAVYDDGYDLSSLNAAEPVCMIGEKTAEILGVSQGEKIALLSVPRYAALSEVYKGEKELLAAEKREAVMYKVIGIIKSANDTANTSIFAGINGPMEDVYGQPFPFGYCECKLVDNRELDEMNLLLTNLKNTNTKYAPKASFYIDSEALEDIVRIRTLLEGLFPIAVAAALLIGLTGQVLVILQSAKEASLLRILGVTKRRARCMLTLEQTLLCIIGIISAAAVLSLYSPELFERSVQTLVFCYILHITGCLCGVLTTAVLVTRHKVLELLQIKE